MPASSAVVVTRPLAQGRIFAKEVEAAGRRAVLFPLLDILPVGDPGPLKSALSRLDSYAMVAFVSPNAIDAAFSLIKAWPAATAIAVMGEGSRRSLASYEAAAGVQVWSPADPLRTDSETLLQTLDLPALSGRRALIVRGENGRELLADGLRAAGVEVEQVAAYRRAAPLLDDERRRLWRELLSCANDWVVTSSEALRVAVDQARELGGDDAVVKMQQQTIICSHVRISESAQSLGFRDIILTASGDERLLVALQSRP